MTTYTEPTRASEIILSEGDGTISRESITIVNGAGVIPVGAVLGKVTGSGHYTWYDNELSDGTETAAAIALEKVDATSAAVTCAVLFRLAEVKADLLSWHNTASAAGLVELAAKYIIAR
jgi:hypothetical protein